MQLEVPVEFSSVIFYENELENNEIMLQFPVLYSLSVDSNPW
jgi:hypothetical protein